MWGSIMQGIGSGLSVAGQGIAAEGQMAAAKFNAGVLRQNERLAREEAEVMEARQRQIAYKQLGSMRAAYGASGVTIEGSPLDVIEESAALAEHDALLIRHAGQVKALGYGNAATLALFEGRVARVAGTLGAASTAFQAAGSMMSGGMG